MTMLSTIHEAVLVETENLTGMEIKLKNQRLFIIIAGGWEGLI